MAAPARPGVASMVFTQDTLFVNKYYMILFRFGFFLQVMRSAKLSRSRYQFVGEPAAPIDAVSRVISHKYSY
jgi:hypothetical protein